LFHFGLRIAEFFNSASVGNFEFFAFPFAVFMEATAMADI
jgi:hypothetical protein